MRTTVDIPDALYRELKGTAAAGGQSVKSLILQGIEGRLRSEDILTRAQSGLSRPTAAETFLTPVTFSPEHLTSISVRIPVSMAHRIEEVCIERKIDRSRLIQDAISNCLTEAEDAVRDDEPFLVPAIASKSPGALKPGSQGVYDYIPFP